MVTIPPNPENTLTIVLIRIIPVPFAILCRLFCTMSDTIPPTDTYLTTLQLFTLCSVLRALRFKFMV